MNSTFRHVALIGKYQTPGNREATAASRSLMADIADFLQRRGCEVSLEHDTAHYTGLRDAYPVRTVQDIGRDCDLALVVGGDGTMLGSGRQLAHTGLPLIGINQGRVGFVTDIRLENYQATLAPMLAGEYTREFRSLIQTCVMRGEECVFEALALNDVVVNRGGTSGMVELRITIDGHFMANQRADGLIIATPTGSTAYAMSAGGPILHPSVAGWIMVPIAPHMLSNRPIVLPDSAVVEVTIVAGRDIAANFDMQSLASLQHGDRIVVRRSEHRSCFLHPQGWSYFDTLRQKLHWNEGGQ
jgi:NAD+ kinase